MPRWAFNRANWDALHDLCHLENNYGLTSPDVYDFHNNLISTISAIAKRTIPTTKPFNKMALSRWSKACEIAINNKKLAFNRMKRTRDPLDIVVFKRARAKAKLTLNEAKKSSWQNYCSSLSSSTKLGQVWSALKTFNRQQSDTHIPTLHQNGVTGTND